jgi:hypothetical protein
MSDKQALCRHTVAQVQEHWLVFDTHRWCCACYQSFRLADAADRPAAALCPGCLGCTGLQKKSWSVKRRKRGTLTSKNPHRGGL